jgi:hypothetical protein
MLQQISGLIDIEEPAVVCDICGEGPMTEEENDEHFKLKHEEDFIRSEINGCLRN